MIAFFIVAGLTVICFGFLFLLAWLSGEFSGPTMEGRFAARTSREIEQLIFGYIIAALIGIASFFILPFLAGIGIGMAGKY